MSHPELGGFDPPRLVPWQALVLLPLAPLFAVAIMVGFFVVIVASGIKDLVEHPPWR